MMTQPGSLVSIAMPVFNGGRDLRLAVQSIVDQTFENWELLIIDDGSSDNAVATLPHRTDPRVRVIADGTNLGLAARLNEAVRLARGEFVARMDHDDVAHPDRLARQVAFLQDNPKVDLLASRCLTMSDQEMVIGELPSATSHAEICRRPWRGFYLPHPSWMGRIDWLRAHPYAVPAAFRCEDQELLLNAYASSTFHSLPEPLLAYRVRGNPTRSVLLRTRLALLAVQLRYFGGNWRAASAALSLLMFAGRVASDALLPAHRLLGGAVDAGTAADWNAWIAGARQRADSADLP